MLVIAIVVVSTIEGKRLTDGYRTDHVKSEVELPITGIKEVVADRAYVDVIGVPPFVEEALKVGIGIAERCLWELDKNDQAWLAANQ